VVAGAARRFAGRSVTAGPRVSVRFLTASSGGELRNADGASVCQSRGSANRREATFLAFANDRRKDTTEVRSWWLHVRSARGDRL
jgi:hypothetical protein